MLEQNLKTADTGDDADPFVHVGQVLRQKLDNAGITPRDFARITFTSPIKISQIIAGKSRVTADEAVRFSWCLEHEAQYWMDLQTRHDIAVAEARLYGPDATSEECLEDQQTRFIVDLTPDQAREFLLKPESYCTIDLPSYFQFTTLLNNVADALPASELSSRTARRADDVNHRIMTNKDGRYAWRPLELIHPALYIDLVRTITEPQHWDAIKKRFSEFSTNENIKCLSLPVESLSDGKDNAAQIQQWHTSVEQKSIELSLDYGHLIQTDIVDCYASIYSHCIAWALHGKEVAKRERRPGKLLGNFVDAKIQDMHLGQTNGIPQGSVLMDFIAEMVLGYADEELAKRCADDTVVDYRILRYRDDYRIFVNNPTDGETILKRLTEVLIELGLKLNPAKTGVSNEVVRSSIKADKLAWIFRKQRGRTLQQSLLMIHDHGLDFPNSGRFVSAMSGFHRRLHRLQTYASPLPLVGIAVDIAIRNPRTYPYVAAILGELIKFIDDDWEKLTTIERIQKRFAQVPNSGHMDVWLQRISFQFDPDIAFREPLCRVVCQQDATIWNKDWITSSDLAGAVEPSVIVNRDFLWEMEPTISPEEIELFKFSY